MNLRCIDACRSLTDGREYIHNNFEKDSHSSYFLRGDDGVKRLYYKYRFEEVKGMLSGKWTNENETEKFYKNTIFDFESGVVVVEIKSGILRHIQNIKCIDEISEMFGLKLKPYEEPKKFLTTLEIINFAFEDKKRQFKTDGCPNYIMQFNGEEFQWINPKNASNYGYLSINRGVMGWKWEEINPNKERIGELKKEIERSKMKIEVTSENIADLYENISLYKDSTELENQLINSYEVELKELEGRE